MALIAVSYRRQADRLLSVNAHRVSEVKPTVTEDATEKQELRSLGAWSYREW
jgi:hypothetical protein